MLADRLRRPRFVLAHKPRVADDVGDKDGRDFPTLARKRRSARTRTDAIHTPRRADPDQNRRASACAPALASDRISAPACPARAASAETLASAQSGVLPAPPDFTAETHRRFRPKLAEVVAMVERDDVEGLRAYRYAGFVSTSPKAIMRYCDLALTALEARAAKAAAA